MLQGAAEPAQQNGESVGKWTVKCVIMYPWCVYTACLYVGDREPGSEPTGNVMCDATHYR